VSGALRLFSGVFGLLALAALVIAVYGVAFPERLLALLSPGSVFQWENFDPMSGEPGWLGLSPLIWTALVVAPGAVLLPLIIYFREKKKVPGFMRGVMATLRCAVLCLLYVLIAGPALVDSERFVEGSKIAVLIDDSLSMGSDAREFPIFNIFDDRESQDVRALREHITGLGVDVAQPPAQGFVTLSDEELEMRGFVRQVVRERAARLATRLREVHGGDFDVRAWQRIRAEIGEISARADVMQSEIAAEMAKDEPDSGRLRIMRGELDTLMTQLRNNERRFEEMLRPAEGAEQSAEERRAHVRRVRALVDNLLETCHPEGPRRWDIACELVMEGTALAQVPGEDMSLLDVVRARAADIRERTGSERMSGQLPMLRYFVFSTRHGRSQLTQEAILEVQLDELDFRAPGGRLTEIDTALREIRRYYTQEDDLSAIVVLTDGRDTSPAQDDEDRVTPRTRDEVEIVMVGVGNPQPVNVLELLSVSADREILKGDFLDFNLKIRADKAYRANPETGEPGLRVEIILAEDSPSNEVGYQELNGIPVRSEADMFVELGPGELTEVRLRFRPENVGRRTYYLMVNRDRLPDEDTYRNNVQTHEVEVIDRRIRVLYLEQRARYQWRYLDMALRRDRKIEYQGFLFDAMDGWQQPISQDPEVAANLRPLAAPFHDGNRIVRNREQFFDLEYDIIILGDIDTSASTSTPFRREYWDWIEEWVSQHRGGLILLPGSGHNPHDYYNIESARALFPVEIEPRESVRQRVDTTRTKYWRLTPSGRGHEVHRLSSNQQRNDELWGSVRDGMFTRGQLRGLYWYAPTGGIKPAPAVALSRVGREGAVTGEGDVLTAAMPYGNGMVFYCGSDDTWLWREFFGDHYFYRFWSNVIRFTASRRLRGPQQRVDVYTDRAQYQVGDQTRVYVELLGDIYEEVVQGQLNELREATGGADTELRHLLVDIQARAEGRLTSRRLLLSEVTWSPNLFEAVIDANEPGQFDVWVHGYEESRREPHRYSVVAPVAELRDTSMDLTGLLRRATELPPNVAPLPYQEGKRMYLMNDLGQASLDVRERQHEVAGTPAIVWERQDDPWSLRTFLLVALLLLLAGEWLNRKLVRMV
jgi:hypothetical protein